jgi:hypothetical protein
MRKTFRTLSGKIVVEADESLLSVRAGRERASVPIAQVSAATVSARGLTNSLGVWGGHNLNLVGSGGVLATIRVPSRRLGQQAADWLNRELVATRRPQALDVEQRADGWYTADGRWRWDGSQWRPTA